MRTICIALLTFFLAMYSGTPKDRSTDSIKTGRNQELGSNCSKIKFD